MRIFIGKPLRSFPFYHIPQCRDGKLKWVDTQCAASFWLDLFNFVSLSLSPISFRFHSQFYHVGGSTREVWWYRRWEWSLLTLCKFSTMKSFWSDWVFSMFTVMWFYKILCAWMEKMWKQLTSFPLSNHQRTQ